MDYDTKELIFLNKNAYTFSVSLTPLAKLPPSSTIYATIYHVRNLLTSEESLYLGKWNQEKWIKLNLSTEYVISDNELKWRGYI